MTRTYKLPYGKRIRSFTLPASRRVERLIPADVTPLSNPRASTRAALNHMVGGVAFDHYTGVKSAAIAINDKTRPVPHHILLPALLQRLEALGLPSEAITLIIATGVHAPMQPDEFGAVLPPDIIARYRVISHDADAEAGLVHLGETAQGTPVWTNRAYMEADLRVVVGNIEPHQFMGFSGGAKSAAIGLAGRATINHNHSMMQHPHGLLGRYVDNPIRQDVEEIGEMIGVDLAVNALLNRHKQIVDVIAGAPRAVMEAGAPRARDFFAVKIKAPFDLVIASPGGHPKDINLYQAQKALAAAAIATKPGGTVILIAACPEGTGSKDYEEWVMNHEAGLQSHEDVLAQFAEEGFRVGPHKAFQIARDATRVQVKLVSKMKPDFVRRLFLTPAILDEAIADAMLTLPNNAHIGVMPLANATVPLIEEKH